MDKINRVILDVEEMRLAQTALERKIKPLVIEGKKSGDGITFGSLDASSAAVTVTFDGGSAELTFNGATVGSGINPIIAVISGRGELRLIGADVARALVIGAKKTD